MNVFRWFTENSADTDGPTHPDLAPVDLPLPPDEAVTRLVEWIGGMRRWAVGAVEGRTIRATRSSWVFGFTDDVTLRVEPTATGSRLHARSHSRVGRGDLGQNRRNLLELFRAVRRGHT